MKKLGIAFAAVATLCIAAAVALATQTNVYGVTAKTSPTKAGTTKKPVGVKLDFNYTVDEQDNKRPAAVKRYSIKFDGIRSNGKYFKTCSADQINSTGDPATDAACPKDALVGTGQIIATVGQDGNEADQSLNCTQTLRVYNGKNSHATLFLQGTPPPAEYGAAKYGDGYCVIPFGKAIDAHYVTTKTSSALVFDVPTTVLHNIPGLTTSVRKVTSTILLRSKTVKGVKHSYYESTGGCSSKGRKIEVTFTPESGPAKTAQSYAKCTK